MNQEQRNVKLQRNEIYFIFSFIFALTSNTHTHTHKYMNISFFCLMSRNVRRIFLILILFILEATTTKNGNKQKKNLPHI